jgi:serine/threonine-protein kinase
MGDANTLPGTFRFDNVVVDARDFRVLKDGQPRHITPKAFEVLIFLIAKRGRTVGKQELFDSVWRESFVTDNALTRMVKEIRSVIGDDANAPRYIETVPKRGYRFVAAVETSDSESSSPRPGRLSDVSSIAVFPFVNESASDDNEYLSEGITESIINNLSRLPKLRVAPRSVVFRLRGCEADPIGTGRSLDVEVVLAGRVSQKGETLIVNAELLDVAKGSQVWGERYHHRVADIFDLQEEISRKICDQLELKFGGGNGTQRPTKDAEAYRLYLKGRYFWNRRPQGLAKGVEYFEQALEKDPGFALAYAGLADSYSTLGSWENGSVPPRVAMPKACAAAERALAIDGGLADAHATLAYAKLHYDCDFEGAAAGFRRALNLNANYAHAWHWLSHLYMAQGDAAKSLEASLRALELEPLDLILNVHLSWHHWLAREPDLALQQAERTRELDPHVIWSSFFAGLALEEKGLFEQAAEEFRLAVKIAPDFPLPRAALAHALGLHGDVAKAREIADALENRRLDGNVPAYDLAIARLGLTERDAALDWLGRAVEERSGWAAYFAVEPRLIPLRGEPSFQNLLARLGLI